MLEAFFYRSVLVNEAFNVIGLFVHRFMQDNPEFVILVKFNILIPICFNGLGIISNRQLFFWNSKKNQDKTCQI